ncbi:ranaspumin-like [Eleutherodactylus coqui]|uniref:ranaspumin-like n=1 Tax=Eleutherodactylus coqui TaxID=57060 RepID=UPI00346207BE
MKAAIAFLFVALNCYIEFGNTGSIATGGVPKDIPSIPKSCLEKLLKVDVPETLIKLQELLCLYMQGKKDHNEELYKEFLKQVHEALKDAGCTVDEILSTEDFLEQIGDKVGEAAEKLGLELLKLVEELGVSDIVLNVLCDLLGETLKSLGESLGGLGGATNIVGGLLG